MKFLFLVLLILCIVFTTNAQQAGKANRPPVKTTDNIQAKTHLSGSNRFEVAPVKATDNAHREAPAQPSLPVRKADPPQAPAPATAKQTATAGKTGPQPISSLPVKELPAPAASVPKATNANDPKPTRQ